MRLITFLLVAVTALVANFETAHAMTVKERAAKFEKYQAEGPLVPEGTVDKAKSQLEREALLKGSVHTAKKSLRKAKNKAIGAGVKPEAPKPGTKGARIDSAKKVLNAHLAGDAAFNDAFAKAKKAGETDLNGWHAGKAARDSATEDTSSPKRSLEELGGSYRDGRQVVKDEDGTSHVILKQSKSNSCVAASFTMMLMAKGCEGVSQAEGRQLIAREETVDVEGAIGRGKKTHRALGTKDWEIEGTWTKYAAAAFKSDKNPCKDPTVEFKSSLTPQALFDKMKAATPAKPLILVVDWTGGGAHAILCIGLNKAKTKIMILDPILGLLYKPVASPKRDYIGEDGAKAGELRLQYVG